MFRGNTVHNSFVSTPNDLVYDTRAWQFDAGAPIRSTPLVDGGLIFFGTTRGDFFAVNKKSKQVKWKYKTGNAINSSAASQDGIIFFTDNKQTIFCLDQMTGKKQWEFAMGEKVAYPWRFDYYHSSPVLYENKIIVGGDDGYVYNLEQRNGKLNWKFKARGLVRSTAAVFKGMILIGDTEGILYALDEKTGKEKWIFGVRGATMNLEEFGFDRKAILAAPVVHQNKIIFGSRDGFLYCLDAEGKQLWEVDHQVSWIVSTVAVKDSFVVTGTSDGRFVQAVNLNTGKEIWKFRPNSLFWSSPLIVNDKVYAGSFDGVLYSLDLKTGQRISQFSTGSKIMSSPVWNDDMLYVGSDDGNLYALSGHTDRRVVKEGIKRFVFHDPDAKVYFRSGADIRVKNFLVNNGFKSIRQDTLIPIMSASSCRNTVIVFASSYMPVEILDNGKESWLRKFLDAGGRVILPGTNTMIFAIDEKTKQPYAFNIARADSVLSINYGPNDTRAMGGQFSCFVTDKGKEFGLTDFWDASVFLKPDQVDMILGKNENGLVSSFVKIYQNDGRFVQVYLHPDLPQNLDAIIKLAEWSLN
jgi:eukaryotic-like serine/threonine-protein kinase